MKILQGLDEKQRQAVTCTEGPILVNAGPGTGKTKIITHRIAYLIQNHGIAPEQILAITFTRKAMEEMRDRTKALLGTKLELDVRIHTFHAFCSDYLREHASEIGLSKNFVVFETETQEEVLIECRRDLKLSRQDYPPRRLREIVEKHKIMVADVLASSVEMQGIHTSGSKATSAPSFHQEETAIIKAYQDKLNTHQALDFDDLIYKTVELLHKVPAVQAKSHHELRYVLVDEYQDVNAVQYALLTLLCPASPRNLMVVADKNQSIYGWRGSSPEYIGRFQNDFDPTIIKLEDHYRCSKKILRAADRVISKNVDSSNDLLKSHQEDGHAIVHCTFNGSNEEANYIIRLVRNLVDERGYAPGDIGILYRIHRHADGLAYRLHHEGVPFQRAGGEHILQKTPAKDVLSYLRVIQKWGSNDLARTLRFPKELVDDLTLAQLKRIARRDSLTLVDMLRRIEDYPHAAGPLTRRNVRRFFEDIDKFASTIEDATISKIMSKLFELLECRRSAFREKEIQAIEMVQEDPNLQMAADTLGRRINHGKPIRIISSHGIDAHCAAYILHQTIEPYLNCDVQLEFLQPRRVNMPEKAETEIDIFIGHCEVFPPTVVPVILIGDMTDDAANVIRLGNRCESGESLDTAKSIIALKLCQRVMSYFERPNYSNVVVYDLETAGRDSNDAEIVEIAAKRLDATGETVETYHRLVKPPYAIPKSSFDVHGISDEKVKGEPSIESVLPEFLDFIQDSILVGHNVIEFDNPILERDLSRHLNTDLKNACYDTLLTARRIYPRESRTLEALAEKFQISYGRLHQAMEDVEINHRVFEELIGATRRQREMHSLEELLPLVGLGILANARRGEHAEVSKIQLDSEPPLGQTRAFLQAAARHMRTHNPNLGWLFATLESGEADDFRVLLQALRREAQPYSAEDEDWNIRRGDFMEITQRFQRALPKADISTFLDYQESITSADELEVDTKKVTLMTMHVAKGTEFRTIIMTDMEEGSFPMRGLTQPTEIEEERRLFYVGVTRAKERLYLSSVINRHRGEESTSSRFIDDIPPDLIQEWSPGTSGQ